MGNVPIIDTTRHDTTRHDTTRHDTTRHDTTRSHPHAQAPSLPSTTIIIPVYNIEKYLPECIDSAIHQTYPDIRIILVDDGSTDSSGKICDQYAQLDPRISVIHKPNGGLSDARNAGLSQATTKYVYFLDSDDYIEPQAIQILHAAAEHYHLDVLCFDADIVQEKDCNYSESLNYWVTSCTYPDVMPGRKILEDFHTNHDYKSPVQLYFYNREFLERSSLTFKKGIIHEDELFTFTALLSAERTMHIPVMLYNHRLRSHSIMSSARSQRNSDSLYVILHEILDNYGHFRADPQTKQAYDIGLRSIAGAYFIRYLEAGRLQDSRGRIQLNEITSSLRAAGYDTSVLERRIKLRHLYSLKAFIARIPGLKPSFRFAKRTAKKLLRHFRPKLDDECSQILAKLRDTNNPSCRRIINLVVPRHGNRGDIAIALAERRLFTENCKSFTLIEIPSEMCGEYSHLIRQHLNSKDILLITGGGFFGSFWRNEPEAALKVLRYLKHNRVIIMPQTVFYFDNKQGRKELALDRKSFANFSDLHVFVRDRNSYELISRTNLFPNAKSVDLVPDMVCAMDFQRLAPEKRSGVVVCLRPDVERVLDKKQRNALIAELQERFGEVKFWSTNPAQRPVKIHNWEEALTESLRTAAGAELVVTDRLHGMLFAAITGTPCVAFDNKTGKVHSVHEWISGCGYVQICRSIDEFEGAVQKAMESPHKWDNSELIPHFRKIIALISEKV